MKTETITVIIPCFNEEEALPVYYQAMQPVMKQMENIDFELLVIDDGSTDHTLLEMKALHQKDPRCKYFSFSRNFGKEAAIHGRNHRIFCGAIVTGICTGTFVLSGFFCHDHRTDLDLGRPCIRMAFSCLHHLYGKWRAAFMYRNCRTVPV